jgi:hypothetical protein
VTGQIFSDPTGRFLTPSSKGNSYLLVVYDYDSNMIFAEPMQIALARNTSRPTNEYTRHFVTTDSSHSYKNWITKCLNHFYSLCKPRTSTIN